MLLILAVVAIGAVQNDRIIDHAKNARDQYGTAQTTENSTIQSYLDKIQEHVGTGSGVASGTGNDETSGGNTPVGNLGKYVKYDADGDGSVEDETILWRVLRDDADKVELITADALGTLDLTPKDFNDGRTKYNNAVSLMVQKCVELTGISSVRNVGGPATEEALLDTNTLDFSELEGFTPTVSDENFTQYEGTTNGLRKDDDNYEEDWNQMEKAGVTKADNTEYYWIASRAKGYYGWLEGVSLGVRCLGIRYGDGTLCTVEEFFMCTVEEDGGANCEYVDNGVFGEARAVRPVLTLEPEILNEASGEGTKGQPIEILSK